MCGRYFYRRVALAFPPSFSVQLAVFPAPELLVEDQLAFPPRARRRAPRRQRRAGSLARLHPRQSAWTSMLYSRPLLRR